MTSLRFFGIFICVVAALTLVKGEEEISSVSVEKQEDEQESIGQQRKAKQLWAPFPG